MSAVPMNRLAVSAYLTCISWLLSACGVSAAEAVFYRAVNLNGPALTIDGHTWEGKDATNFTSSGQSFENQSVALKPATDAARAKMIRSSRWGSKVDAEFTGLPQGAYQVFLYVWEDNHSERFDLLVNDRPVMEGFHSGSAGAWKKLGPWPAASTNSKIKISARAASHGAANFSGLELWAGNGMIPTSTEPQFVTALTDEHREFFERRIRPLLVENCYECHSTEGKKIKGGLLLDSRAGIVKGGDTGAAIVPGSPEASLLIRRCDTPMRTSRCLQRKNCAPRKSPASSSGSGWARPTHARKTPSPRRNRSRPSIGTRPASSGRFARSPRRPLQP
jgi:hypothetical protein